MPRYVAKQSDDLQEYAAAIKEIKINKKSSRFVANSRGLSRSRIMRYLKKFEEAELDVATVSEEMILDMLKSSSTMGAKPIFNVEHERALMKYILKSTDIYHGMSIKELKILAFNYAKVINIKYPDEWNTHGQASRDWYYAFMRRHPELSLRTPEQMSASNVGVTSDLHHVPLIADGCLDLAVTPKNIKAGFKASGVFPFNRHAFTDVDFVAAHLSGENQSDDEDKDGETQRRIVLLSSTHVAANEEALTSEPSTSGMANTSGTSLASLHDALKAVGPVKQGTLAKKSNRGRKPMKTSILTSPEVVSDLQQKADNKRKKTEAQKQKDDAKANPAKQQKSRASVTPKKEQQEPGTTGEDVDDDPCIICGKKLAKKQNQNNTIHCNECDRAAHMRCAHMTGVYFTCKNEINSNF